MLRRLISFCFLMLLSGMFAMACTPEPDSHTPAGTQRTGTEGSTTVPVETPKLIVDTGEKPEDPDDAGTAPTPDEGTPVEADCTPTLLVDCGS